ncbi:uncharacterized protein LOC110689279 [Chenopodium quinoa]|uniref:Uncharacterized protein n=1 Tax=Chenopodium quinoa TaxID=63459 RepID=A0A803LMB0_CHEQI|nr:uncharacterized protein LOC110689279 [Chenopodium quinoa]
MAAYNSESESQDKTIISTTTNNQTTTPNFDHQEDEEEVIVYEPKSRIRKPRKRVPQVCLEGYVEPSDDDDLPRTKSLTDDDLDELKGCVDLGFGFSYDEIPELCNTLPALELCYSMSQKFLDDYPNQQQHHQQSLNHANNTNDTASSSGSESSSPMPTWKISSPGDHPEDVKARLKFWAQAVACTVKLCS